MSVGLMQLPIIFKKNDYHLKPSGSMPVEADLLMQHSMEMKISSGKPKANTWEGAFPLEMIREMGIILQTCTKLPCK